MNNIFKKLFIFEMANNHQGDVKLGLKIISEMAKLKRKYQINCGVKLQLRDLDSFIHPDYISRTDVKHIPRFLSTRLSNEKFRILLDAIHAEGMLSIVTPFDENSVQNSINLGAKILKVASCSAKDWPLLEEISKTKRPLIISTGGCNIEDIDEIYSYFTHKRIDFSLLHCVAQYPANNDSLCLSFIDKLKNRYPEIAIGWSGHEAPDNYDPIKVAIAKGAEIFERHVGVPTETIQLNAYSMYPQQVDNWLDTASTTMKICGNGNQKHISQEELDSLLSLQRGVYAKKEIAKGKKIEADDIFFAMPCLEGQLQSSDFGKYRAEYFASREYNTNEAIFEECTIQDKIRIIRSVVHEAKGLLYEANIHIGEDFSVELSHHYGIQQFRSIGAVIINIINRKYCKKLIIVLPGQLNPTHKHLCKEETFQLLTGDLTLKLNKQSHCLKPGDKMLVEPGVFHSFQSNNGAIFEEISTTHLRADSIYEDVIINKLDPLERKTIIDTW
ncbi:MAG: N-acetylneuraminate synthase family protein [Verrucomicrobiota bacterium]|nr:N-acetylneuraminate synthase family protein [Verrucomicrobiota bacterium]